MSTFAETPFSSDLNSRGKAVPTRSLYKVVLRSPVFIGILATIAIAAVVPILIYLFFASGLEPNGPPTHSCAVDPSYRVPCGLFNISEKSCVKINCCFDNGTSSCYQFVSSKYYYIYDEQNNYYKAQENKTPFDSPSIQLQITVNEISETNMKIILHKFGEKYENNVLNGPKYYNVTNTGKAEKLLANILRSDTGELLLTTVKGPLIASNDYWEWTFQLTEEKLFGLGETLINYDDQNSTTKVIYKNRYDHSTLPIFLASSNEKFHGAVVYHDGPLEVTVLKSNLIILKTISGKRIEIEVCTGPTPKDVRKQLNDLARSFTFTQWQLGVHVCREEKVSSFETILEQYGTFTKDAQMIFKYESDCIHNDLILQMLIENKSGPDIDDYITSLDNKKFLLSFPPQIPTASEFYKSSEKSIYMTQEDGLPYVGKYKQNDVVYPNYSDPNIDAFLENLITTLNFDHIDGIVFTNSWPENEQYNMEKSSGFSYMSENLLEAMSFTLPWDLEDQGIKHFVQHNNYIVQVQEKVEEIFRKKSYLSDYGQPTPHIVENVDISWSNLRTTIRQNLFSSIFLNHLIEVPVCGSTSEYDPKLDESLCLRWYLMAATMPLFRISSHQPARDPTNFSTKYAQQKATDIINKRNALIPFYQTVLKGGEPLVRPMFYVFPEDESLYDLDHQYMIGENLLVAQPLVPNADNLKVYLPSSVKVWYEFWGGEKYESAKNKPWLLFPIFETDWISFMAEGSIIPLMGESEEIKLIVALNGACQAEGQLFIKEKNEEYFINISVENGILVSDLKINNLEICQNNKLQDVKFHPNSCSSVENKICAN